METQIEKPALTKTTGLENCNDTHSNTNLKIRKGTEQYAILSALASGRSLNRFQAMELHDTCLNSTISTLQGKGIRIHRIFEKVPCIHGTKKVDVCRYFLKSDQLPIAMELLGGMS